MSTDSGYDALNPSTPDTLLMIMSLFVFL
jgi:hypothetical protein